MVQLQYCTLLVNQNMCHQVFSMPDVGLWWILAKTMKNVIWRYLNKKMVLLVAGYLMSIWHNFSTNLNFTKKGHFWKMFQKPLIIYPTCHRFFAKSMKYVSIKSFEKLQTSTVVELTQNQCGVHLCTKLNIKTNIDILLCRNICSKCYWNSITKATLDQCLIKW